MEESSKTTLYVGLDVHKESIEGRRKLDPAGSRPKVMAMLRPHGLQMTSEIRLDCGWQHRHSVLVTLAAPHDDPVRPEVDVLDTPAAALQQPHPGSVEQGIHLVPQVAISIQSRPGRLSRGGGAAVREPAPPPRCPRRWPSLGGGHYLGAAIE